MPKTLSFVHHHRSPNSAQCRSRLLTRNPVLVKWDLEMQGVSSHATAAGPQDREPKGKKAKGKGGGEPWPPNLWDVQQTSRTILICYLAWTVLNLVYFHFETHSAWTACVAICKLQIIVTIQNAAIDTSNPWGLIEAVNKGLRSCDSYTHISSLISLVWVTG